LASKIPDAVQQSSTAACASEELQSDDDFTIHTTSRPAQKEKHEDDAFNAWITTSDRTMWVQVSWNGTIHTERR
jgi:hypothetical protein